MLFQAKLFKGVLPGPGEGTQLPTKSEAGLHRQAAFLSPPPGRVLPWTPPSRVPSSYPGSGMLAIQSSLSRELIRISDKQPCVQAVQLSTV